MRRRPANDFMSEIESGERRGMNMPSLLLSEILAGEEYDAPDVRMPEMGPRRGAVIPSEDFRGMRIEDIEYDPMTTEIPGSGIDFLPPGTDQRFRDMDLDPVAREAFAFPVEEGETTIDAKRRMLEDLKSRMTPEQRNEFEIQKQNYLRQQRMR